MFASKPSRTEAAPRAVSFGQRTPFSQAAPRNRGLEWKSRKSRDTWSNRQIWPWRTKRSRVKFTNFAKRMHSSQQIPSSNSTREDCTHGHHQTVNTDQIDYILCSQRWRSSIQSAKTRPGTDCGSDHELLIAKFRLKLKKVGKTTRPFRYHLNKIPYYCTVEVTNRFKGLDLIECLMNYGQRFITLNRRW